MSALRWTGNLSRVTPPSTEDAELGWLNRELTCSPQSALNQLLHKHSLPDCHCVLNYPPALFSGRIPGTWSALCPWPHLFVSALVTWPAFCLQTLHLPALCLPVCNLPGFSLKRLLPYSELVQCSQTRLTCCGLFGLLNIENKVLNCASLDLCCSLVLWILVLAMI